MNSGHQQELCRGTGAPGANAHLIPLHHAHNPPCYSWYPKGSSSKEPGGRQEERRAGVPSALPAITAASAELEGGVKA